MTVTTFSSQLEEAQKWTSRLRNGVWSANVHSLCIMTREPHVSVLLAAALAECGRLTTQMVALTSELETANATVAECDNPEDRDTAIAHRDNLANQLAQIQLELHQNNRSLVETAQCAGEFQDVNLNDEASVIEAANQLIDSFAFRP